MRFNRVNTAVTDNAQRRLQQVLGNTRKLGRHDQKLLDRFPPKFRARVKVEGSCWMWIGAAVFPPGHPEHRYGNYSSTGRIDGIVKAHRFAYQFFYKTGVLPGFDVDHICQVKLCVNPRHLRVITHADNCKLRTHSGPRRRAV